MNTQRQDSTIVSFEKFSNSRFNADPVSDSEPLYAAYRPKPLVGKKYQPAAKFLTYWVAVFSVTVLGFMAWAGTTLLVFGLLGLVPALVYNTAMATAIIAFGGVSTVMSLGDRAATAVVRSLFSTGR